MYRDVIKSFIGGTVGPLPRMVNRNVHTSTVFANDTWFQLLRFAHGVVSGSGGEQRLAFEVCRASRIGWEHQKRAQEERDGVASWIDKQNRTHR